MGQEKANKVEEIVEFEGFDPHENILLKIDVLKSTSGLSL